MAGSTRKNCVLCGIKSEGLPHFRFPADLVLFSAWANACHIDPASVSRSHKLCCKHFKPEDYSDYLYGNVESPRTRLKRDRIPTLELPDIADCANEDDSDQRNETNGDGPATEVNEYHHSQPATRNLVTSEQSANDRVQLLESPPEMNVDDMNDGNDENDPGDEINYDEYGEEIPAELNNLANITRFIKKKDKRLKRAALHNRRLKKRLEKLRDEYFEFEDERGIKLPDLCDLELDM